MYGQLQEQLKNTLAEIESNGLYKRERIITTPMDALVKVNGKNVVPREVLHKMFETRLPVDEPDVVLVRVEVTGMRSSKPVQLVFDCIDYADQAVGLSAMMRMTAFPASIIAQMIARGDIMERGVLRQEAAVPTRLFLTEMDGRGINLVMTEREPSLKH